MNYREKILDFYKILLAVGWLEVDDDGLVSLVIADERRPATIDGKRVILPTREQMKNRDWSNRIGFHPLRESYNLGISDPLANLRDQFVMRLNTTIAYLMKELLAIAHDQQNQKNLTTEQAQVLNALSTVTDNTVKNFEDLQKKTRARQDADQFINIFIRRGGMVKGQTYGRAAIITFPLYEQLKQSDDKVNGVKFSAKDRALLIRLYEFIFPTITDKESFSVGINTKTAPFLEALVRSTFNVVDQLVETSRPYLDLVAVPSILQFPEDMGVWMEIFDSKDLAEKLAASIPNLSRTEELVEEVQPAEQRPAERSERQETVRQDVVSDAPAKSNVSVDTSRPRGRMIMGAAASNPSGEGLGKSRPDQETTRSGDSDRAVMGSRSVSRDSDMDRDAIRRQREEADRERRLREKEDQEYSDRRRREREEEDRRYRERQRERERDDDRGRDDRYDRDRDRDRGRDDRDDRDRDRRTGDVFDDNPVLRRALRDENDRGRRSYYDDRRDGRRVRDLRDRGRDDRYDDRDYYDRDRGYRYRR